MHAKAWEPPENGENRQEYGLTSLWHTHARFSTTVAGGSTSPRPEQHSVLNFDPCHYLPRRWGLGWGDNLWTLTSNPEAWAGPCQDNLMSICASAMEEKRQHWGFRGKRHTKKNTWTCIFCVAGTALFIFTCSLVRFFTHILLSRMCSNDIPCSPPTAQ